MRLGAYRCALARGQPGGARLRPRRGRGAPPPPLRVQQRYAAQLQSRGLVLSGKCVGPRAGRDHRAARPSRGSWRCSSTPSSSRARTSRTRCSSTSCAPRSSAGARGSGDDRLRAGARRASGGASRAAGARPPRAAATRHEARSRSATRRSGGRRLLVIAGPCVVESAELCLEVAAQLQARVRRARPAVRVQGLLPQGQPLERRARSRACRHGRGARRCSRACSARSACRCSPTCTRWPRSRAAAEVADVLQIPAFLCRQTALLAGRGAHRPRGEREEGPVPARPTTCGTWSRSCAGAGGDAHPAHRARHHASATTTWWSTCAAWS